MINNFFSKLMSGSNAISNNQSNSSNSVNSDETTTVALNHGGYDVFLLAGQSNSVGFGAGIDLAYDFSVSDILQYPGNGTYEKQLILAVEPLKHKTTENNGAIGFGMSFAKLYRKNTGRQVILIPAAMGATGFSTNHWNPGESLFEYAVQSTLEVLNLNSRNTLVSILWHQGESDTSISPASYQLKLDAMINAFRTRLNLPNLPFIMGEMVESWVSEQQSRVLINNIIKDTPNRIDNCVCVGSGKLMPLNINSATNFDKVHFNAVSLRLLGKRYFDGLYSKFISPHAPRKIRNVTNVSTDSALALSWISDPALNWEVSCNNATIITNIPYCTISNLFSSTSYEVKIKTVNKNGKSDDFIINFSTSSSTAPTTAPTVVTSVVATPSNTSVLITWQSDATSWQISGTGMSTQNVTSKTITVSGLTAATTYTFNIIAINTAGQSASTPVTFTTSANPVNTIPVANFEYLFEGNFSNTGSQSTVQPTNIGVTLVTDSTRGQVAQFSTDTTTLRYLNTNATMSADYTKAAWVKTPVSPNSNVNIVSGLAATTTTERHALYVSASTKKISAGYSDNATYANVSDPNTILVATWTHIAVTRLGTTTKLFINGQLVSTGLGNFIGSTEVLIGNNRANDTGVNNWIGQMDKVQIWNNALTDAQIAAIYAQG